MRRLIKLNLALFLLINIANASKIVSVGGSITEAIVALGHENNLIGVDQSSIYPKDLTSKLPKVGYWLNLPKEGILSLKPEVVILSEQSKPKDIVEYLSKNNIKTYIIDDKPTLESTILKINQIGKILNEEEKARKISNRIETNVLQIKKEIEGKNKPKVLLLFSMNKSMTMASGIQTKAGEMISLAGGENVITAKQSTKISPESILQLNPDIIIESTISSKQEIIDRNLFSGVNAVKNNQIYNIDFMLISGFSVRLDEALIRLACIFNDNKLSVCK